MMMIDDRRNNHEQVNLQEERSLHVVMVEKWLTQSLIVLNAEDAQALSEEASSGHYVSEFNFGHCLTEDAFNTLHRWWL